MDRLHFKTELCDGCCHMTAHEYYDHRICERNEAHRKALLKMAYNPILTDDARSVLKRAVTILDDAIFYRKELIKYRNAYFELKDKYEKGE